MDKSSKINNKSLFKIINNHCFKLYTLLGLNQYTEFNSYILENNIDITIDNPGLTSLVINYYIGVNQHDILISYVSDRKLNKRDLLNLIKYLYPTNRDLADQYFKRLLDNNDMEDRDLDWFISNNLTVYIKQMDGVFLKSHVLEPNLDNKNVLKLYHINSNISQCILDRIKLSIESKEWNKYIQYISSISYNCIIDGNNILFSKSGKITPGSFNCLKTIYNTVNELIGKPLVIIHKRHLGNIPEYLLDFFNRINIYPTPYKHNDDWFILIALLYSLESQFIISNDKFRDHIFKYDIDLPNKHQLKNILFDQTISYSYIGKGILINNFKSWSNCIQVTDKKIYIPTQNNGFHMLESN